jgi:hypothetical protein
MTKTSLAAASALAYPFASAAFAQAPPSARAAATAASSPASAPANADSAAVATAQTVVIKAAREGHAAADAGSATRARYCDSTVPENGSFILPALQAPDPIDLANPAYDLSFGAGTPINLTQTDRYRTIAAYVQDQAAYGALRLTGSLRLTQLEFQELEEATDKTYHHVSPRIGATLALVPGIALYAGYATAFRAPFGFVGSQTPKPETSRNVEGGLKLAVPGMATVDAQGAYDFDRYTIEVAGANRPVVASSSPTNISVSRS